MDTVKKPIDTAKFFRTVCKVLKEKEMMPDIVDCIFTTHEPVFITTSNFQLKSYLDYDSNGSIELVLWIEFGGNNRRIMGKLGTFKTFSRTYFAMETMGKLLGSFIFESHQYVESNPNDFDWYD